MRCAHNGPFPDARRSSQPGTPAECDAVALPSMARDAAILREHVRMLTGSELTLADIVNERTTTARRKAGLRTSINLYERSRSFRYDVHPEVQPVCPDAFQATSLAIGSPTTEAIHRLRRSSLTSLCPGHAADANSTNRSGCITIARGARKARPRARQVCFSSSDRIAWTKAGMFWLARPVFFDILTSALSGSALPIRRLKIKART